MAEADAKPSKVPDRLSVSAVAELVTETGLAATVRTRTHVVADAAEEAETVAENDPL